LKYRLWFVYNGFVVALAFVWRRLLFKTTFIGITGSVGKTTAKECAYALLSASFTGVKTTDNRSARKELPRTILRARPWHRFVVAEVGIVEPGIMWRSALLLKPDIVLFLGVKRNHIRSFGSLEETADEKAKLLQGMSRGGLAILNADDPQTARIARRLACSIRWFGTSAECDYRGGQGSAKWPERLSFVAHHAGEAEMVRTQLIGVHWMPAVLAAIAAGLSLGIPLENAVKPLLEVPPFPARLEPVDLPSGAVVLRDEYNGSIDSLDVALDVLREYGEGRRILVISDIVDLPGNYRHRLKHIARVAIAACDVCVFVGSKAHYGKRRAMDAGMADSQVYAFELLNQAAAFLERDTGPGDLILLRGRRTDDLSRVFATIPLSKPLQPIDPNDARRIAAR
jgi:UDP-N-acetylmuramoyl-tripeptide--D-alanyl-D-alanine ligase